MHTACLWSEKLPFAGYSVDKDHSAPGFALRACVLARGDPYAPLRLHATARILNPSPPCSSRTREEQNFKDRPNQRAEAGHLGPRRGKARVNRAPVNMQNPG